jgi:hypothetical protein
LGYTLLVNWAGLIWFGVALLVFFVTTFVQIAYALREEVSSLAEVKEKVLAGLRFLNAADRIVKVGTPACNLPPANICEPEAPAVIPTSGQNWLECLKSLKIVLLSNLILGVLVFLFVPWIRKALFSVGIGDNGLVFVIIFMFAAGSYLNRKTVGNICLGRTNLSNWAVRFVGVAACLVAAFLLVVPLFDAFMPVTSVIGRLFSFRTSILLVGLGLVFSGGGHGLLRLSTYISATDAMRADQRPPVLYLRSFARESRLAAYRKRLEDFVSGVAQLGRLTAGIIKTMRMALASEDDDKISETVSPYFELKRERTFSLADGAGFAELIASGRIGFSDEQLTIARIFRQMGPYIGIARPGETTSWSDVGSWKLRVQAEHWKEVVSDLIQRARVIIIEAGSSKGLLWELTQVTQKARPRTVLLILPRGASEYNKFREYTASIFPVPLPNARPSSRFVMFDDWWNPYPLKATSNPQDSPITMMSITPILRPFLKRNGYEVPEFWTPMDN